MFPLLGQPQDSRATALKYVSVMERKQIYAVQAAEPPAGQESQENQQDAESKHPEHRPAWLQR